MASLFGIKIDDLRKRSRVLLTCLEENAKVIRREVKKLNQRDQSSKNDLKRRLLIYGSYSDIWKLRNDSSGVGAALCPDYFRFSPKYESLSEPDMSGNKRLLIKSEKKYQKPSPQRRGVKECYCYTSLPDTTKNMQKSAKTKLKPTTLSFQKNNTNHCGDDGSISVVEPTEIDDSEFVYDKREEEYDQEKNHKIVYSPPLSSATLRRAQKIDYTPRSKFLRKLQSKMNNLRSSSDGSPVRLTPKSPSPSPRKIYTYEKNSKLKNEREFPLKHNCRCIDSEAINTATFHKTLLPKKTIISKKVTNPQQKSIPRSSRPVRKSPIPNKRVVRVMEEDNYACRETMDDKNLRQSLQRNCERNCPCSEFNGGSKYPGEITDDEEAFDFDISNVRKFREKNYFDTHASNPSLLGSKSSGSVQQFRLNERLFPEPMGKIHREDIVVSIPPCATRQKKAIHYFPRNVIKQERNTSNNIYLGKRRCPSCPLIGHAVDLGAIKVSHPTNSFALRYQKGIP